MFDIDATGVKQSVGWVKPSDGFLALDRDGNGTIDSGAELFGDSTTLSTGGTAADGFAAVADLDGNADGLINAQDTAWADLRVWQDLNQDGISDVGELKTMAEAGIANITVGKTEHFTVLDNGNALADLGTYTRTDGTEGTTGSVGQLADINLAVDTFHTQFTDTIPATTNTETLPDMGGSGQVRSLRQAASLQTPEGVALANLLNQYAHATSRTEQMALLDTLLKAWSDTSTMLSTFTGAYAGHDLTVDMQSWYAPSLYTGSPDYYAWADKLTIMERFNGRTYQPIPEGNEPVTLTLWHSPRDLLQISYDTLKQSVYDSLLVQTRLKPYLDDISLSLTGTGIALDFNALDTRLANFHDTDAAAAVGDLLDLRRLMGDTLEAAGWDGLTLLTDWAATDAGDAAVAATLAEFGYGGGIHTAATGAIDGGDANDLVAGQAGDPSTGSGQVINGGAGNDMLLGGNGNDTLIGGTGNDLLHGGAGNDTYVFNAKDGNDTILETHGDTSSDTLQFGTGITVGDISIAQEGDALVFRHINGRDSVTVAHWFANDPSTGSGQAPGKHTLDSVTFAGGRSFDLNTLQLGGANADVLTALATTPGGVPLNQILAGGAGNDTLTGGDGNDWLLGGTGADTMSGGAGNDTYSVDNAGDVVIESADQLTGSPLTNGVDVVESSISSYTLTDNVENLTLVGASGISGTGNSLDNVITGNAADNLLQGMDGNDTLIGNTGNDTLDGGLGTDVMAGGVGNDVYIVDTLADTIIELAGQGTDTVYTDLTYTLGSNLENLTLTGTNAADGTGNELNNVLTGNSANNTLSGMAGNDTLDGGLGADTLLGGVGDDTYIVDNTGDLVIENAAEGIDTVKSAITYTLTDNVENLTLTSLTGSGQAPAAIDGTGNVLDIIIGNVADNTLTVLEGNDTLTSGATNDEIWRKAA